MSLGGILILVLLVVSLFVFIYLIVITVKSWGVLQTVLLSCLFIECWVFLLFAGTALDKRLTLMKEYSTAAANVAKLKKEVQKLTVGGDNVSEDQDAYIPLSGKARRLAADRGRVWRNTSKAGFDEGTLRLELTSAAVAPEAAEAAAPATAPADGASADGASADGAPAAAPASAGVTIPPNMIVYAFTQGALEPTGAADAAPAAAEPVGTEDSAPADQPAQPAAEAVASTYTTGSSDSTGDTPLPKAFVGEFRVAQSAPGSVTLQPVFPLGNHQVQNINDADSFVLYEALPQDSHDIFITPGSQPSEQAVFGQANQAALNQFLQAVPEERRQAVLSAYLRDGTDANDNDPSINVWVHVEVVNPIKMDVDGGKTSATEGTYFDINGRTVDSRLMLGAETKEVTIAEGKQLLLPQSTDVTNYISSGDLKVLRRVYVRPLNAYETGLTELRVRYGEVVRLLEAAEREAKMLQESSELNDATRQAYAQLSERRVFDRDKYQQEADALTREVQATNGQVEQAKQEMIKYWQAIHALRDQMFSR